MNRTEAINFIFSIIRNYNRYLSSAKKAYKELSPLFRNQNITTNIQFFEDLILLSTFYAEFPDEIEEIKQNIINNTFPQKDHDIYFLLKKLVDQCEENFMDRSIVIRNYLNLNKDLESIVIKYDYYFFEKEKFRLTEEYYPINILPDNRIVGITNDGKINILQDNPSKIMLIKDIYSYMFLVHPNDKLLIINDEDIDIYDTITGNLLFSILKKASANDIAFLPDGKIVIKDLFSEEFLFEVYENNQPFLQESDIKNYILPIFKMSNDNPDLETLAIATLSNDLIIVSNTQQIKIYNWKTGKVHITLENSDYAGNLTIFANDRIVSFKANHLKMWNSKTGSLIYDITFTTYISTILSIDNTTWAISFKNDTVRIYNNYDEVKHYQTPGEPSIIKLLPGGEILIGTSLGKLQMINSDFQTYRIIVPPLSMYQQILFIGILKNGKVVTSSANMITRIWI